MEYYLQVLFGLIVLVTLVVPMSTNIKAISIKNIVAAILVMFIFGFILLNDYVAGFFEVISAGVAKLSQLQPMELHLYLARFLKNIHMLLL